MLSRKNVGVILLVGFISVAVFGFVAMGDGHGHVHGGCIAATAQGLRSCHDLGESAESLIFHVQTFKSFSQALLAGILVLAMFCFIARYGILQAVGDNRSVTCQRFAAPLVARFTRIWQQARAPVVYWLALHEARDREYLQWVQVAYGRA